MLMPHNLHTLNFFDNVFGQQYIVLVPDFLSVKDVRWNLVDQADVGLGLRVRGVTHCGVLLASDRANTPLMRLVEAFVEGIGISSEDEVEVVADWEERFEYRLENRAE